MTRTAEKVIWKDESYAIIGACFAVYKDKGRGFLEPVYHECLEIEFDWQRIPFLSKPPQTLQYRGRTLVQILAVIGSTRIAKQTFPPLASQQADDVRNIGLLLFGNYNLPFQVIAVVILVATIGVIVLSKRELR